MSSSDQMRLIDRRVRMALSGSETHRAVVEVVRGKECDIRLGTALLTALVTGHVVVAGSVVELQRPRGVGGQLQVVRVLG